MKEGRRPEICWKAGSIKERANFDRKGVVVYFGTTILRWAVGAGGFNNVPEVAEHHCAECGTTSQLPALISANNTGGNAELRHECAQDIKGWFFGLGKKRPDPSGCAINNN
jgi:hypothetical protein